MNLKLSLSCKTKKNSLAGKCNIVFSNNSKVDRSKFKKLVKEHQTDKHNKGFDSWSHLISILFCHFARSKSVRDISNGLRSDTRNLNNLKYS